MNTEKLGQEPAFPEKYINADGTEQALPGMSKRFYAAIKLRVPDSGEEWLDDMIRKANRQDAARAAMQGLLASNSNEIWGNINIAVPKYVAELSIKYADELLKQENL